MRSSASLLRCLARASTPQTTLSFRKECIPASKRLYHSPRTSIAHRPQLLSTLRHPSTPILRNESTSSKSASPPATGSSQAPESRLDRDQVPAYELTFTCNKCDTRSSHRVSKQGYHHGTVLISCPGCKNRHLMSDHLKIFSDKPVTIEDLMREKGQLVKRGSLNTEGDVEFWDDGSETPRSANFIPHTSDGPGGSEQGSRLTDSSSSHNSASDSSDFKPPRKV